MSLLFNPESSPPRKKFRNDEYEAYIFKISIPSRRKDEMPFTAQNLADITTNTAKISADGTVNTHSDVALNGALTAGDHLVYDGSSWTNEPLIPPGSINIHTDVETVEPNQGDILSWNGSNWTNSNSITGITPEQAANILVNNQKVGITPEQAADILINNLKIGITPEQAANILINNLKIGISPEQAADILVNNLKTGISPEQAADILSNNLKIGITLEQAADILSNNLKVGITTQQIADITANNSKISADGPIDTHSDVILSSPTIGDTLVYNGSSWVNSTPPSGGTDGTLTGDNNLSPGEITGLPGRYLFNRITDTTSYTDPVNQAEFIIPAFNTYFSCSSSQDAMFSVSIYFERFAAGVFIFILDGQEIGTNTRTGGTVGMGQQYTDNTIQHTTMEYKYNLSQGNHLFQLGLKTALGTFPSSFVFKLNRMAGMNVSLTSYVSILLV